MPLPLPPRLHYLLLLRLHGADASASLYLPNPIYHQIAFSIVSLAGIIRNLMLIRRLPPDHVAKPLVTKTMGLGVLIFAGGFAVWNMDNIFCAQLTAIREVIGWPGFLLQGATRFLENN
jgi:dihydroceramidase